MTQVHKYNVLTLDRNLCNYGIHVLNNSSTAEAQGEFFRQPLKTNKNNKYN